MTDILVRDRHGNIVNRIPITLETARPARKIREEQPTLTAIATQAVNNPELYGTRPTKPANPIQDLPGQIKLFTEEPTHD
jgi:hypothetical protein